MFVREKKITKNGKLYDSYYQVVEGKRVDGKVKQTLVGYLGKFESKSDAVEAAIERGYAVGHNAKPKKTKRSPSEPSYLSKLKKLDEQYRAVLVARVHAPEVREALAEAKKAEKNKSAAYDEFGEGSEEYKAAGSEATEKREIHGKRQGPYFRKAFRLKDKAADIYNSLSPDDQNQLHYSDLEVVKRVVADEGLRGRLASL